MADRRPKAMLLVYCAVMMTGLMALISLAVDWGRVQTAKTELRNATDAAARYAVSGLSDGTAVTKAQQVAIQNYVDGSTLSLLSTDVQTGTWDDTARTFTAGGSNPNAVQVIAQRSSARGNAVPLIFAQVIGKPTCDVTATSIAYQASLPYSMVALTSISMGNASLIQRTSSETGSVVVASNGSWSLSGTSLINGDILYKSASPAGHVSGSKTDMGANISYANVTTPTGCTTPPGGSFSASSGGYTVAGNYSVYDLNLTGTFALTLSGNTTIYCSHNCTLGGGVTVNTNGYKLTVYMTAAGTIALSNSNPLRVIIYGPQCTMTVNSTGKITGSFVCNTLNMSNGTIEYTAALPIPVAPTGGGTATISGGVEIVR